MTRMSTITRTLVLLATLFRVSTQLVHAQEQQTKAPSIAAGIFDKPTGPYAVGTFDTVWVDVRRDEILTKSPNDKRNVPVRVWYPAKATAIPPAKYVLRPEEFGASSPFAPVLHVTTHSVLHAPPAAAHSFPVLLYNHGGGWTRFTATFVIEQLVSLGYVVVSVDHLGFDQSHSLSNGYEFTGDTLGFPTPSNKDLRADALASWDYLEKVLFPIWVADAQFALDQIEQLNRDRRSPLKGKLDLKRIGAFGWSFGGATAVDLLIRDPRVQAAIDHDGQLFGLGRQRGATRPVMLLHNTDDPLKRAPEGQQDVLKEMVKAVSDWDDKFRSASTNDVYDIRIARTAHGNFSDLTLFYPRDTSTMEPKRAHAIITAYTVAFFGKTLRGRPSALLDSSPTEFPEVTFVHRGPSARSH